VAQKKGITVEIGASTKGLDKALKDIRSQSRKIGRELYQVNRALKFNPDSVELWAQKQDILTERVEQTKEKLDVLKQAEKDMQKQYKSGDVGEKEYREYRRELIKTEDQLESFTDELEKTQRKANEFSRKMQKAADGMEKFGNRMKGIGDNLNTHVTLPLTAAFFTLTEGTRDFRKEISVLKNNADTAGVSMEELDGKMAQLNAVTGELDSNVEGLSSLLAAGFRDEQLTGVINELSGAVTKFPDTLKFENLSESLQETIGSGKSVGQFDELLSRLGINLDDFNEGLQTAKENGRATDFVMRTLANNGLAASYDQYVKNNEALVESAEAHYELQSSLAELGAELEPIMTDIVTGVTDVVDVFNDLSEEEQDMVIFGAAVAASLGPLLSITGNLSLTISSLAGAISGAGGLSAAMSGLASSFGPFLAGGAALAGLINLVTKLKEAYEFANLAKKEIQAMTLAELENRQEDLKSRKEILEGQIDSGITNAPYSLEQAENMLDEIENDLSKVNKRINKINKEANESINLEIDTGEDGGGGLTSGSENDYKSYMEELEAEIDSYNFEQEVSEMSNESKRTWEKLKRDMEAEKERIDQLKDATKEQKDNLKEMVEQFYNNQYTDYLEQIDEQEAEKEKQRKKAAIEREEQLQNELELLKKEGKKRELAQLKQQYEAEKELMQEKGQDTATLTKIYEQERLDIIEKYDKKEKNSTEDLVEWKYKNGFISLEYYRNYLQKRLGDYKQFSDKWQSIYENLQTLPDSEESSGNLLKDQVYGNLGNDNSEGEEGAKSINWMTDAFVDLGLEIEEANQKFVDWKDDLVTGLSDAIARGEDLGDVFDNIADQIASMVLQKAVVGPIVNWALGGIGLPTFHKGGFVSPANAIANIQRFHTGGGVGLRNDEVPAILENGEYVLNKNQVKGLQNSGGGSPVYIFDITAVDTQSFAQAIQRNPEAVVGVAVQDIMRNGNLRKAIKKS